MQTLKQHFISIFTLTCLAGSTQAQDVILKFYDSSWMATTQDAAYYVTQNTKVENMYVKKTYWVESQKLHSVYTGPGLLLNGKKIGQVLYYHANGLTKDSAFYEQDGHQVFAYRYHSNGQLAHVIHYGKSAIDSARHYYEDGSIQARYVNNKNIKEKIIQGFDEKGNQIKDYVYSMEAAFTGGSNSWRNFLQLNLNPNVPIDNGAPAGTYHVIARFIVEKDGTVSGIQMETRHGYGMEQEVLRMLQVSPKWAPAVFLNQPVKAYRRQPVTFVISEKRS